MDLMNFLNITALSDNSVIVSGYRRDKDTGFSNASTYLLKLGSDQNNLSLSNSFGAGGKLRDNLCDYDDVYNSLAIDENENIFATGFWWRGGVIGTPIVKYDMEGNRASFNNSDPNTSSIVFIDNWQHINRFQYPLSSTSIKYDKNSSSLIYANLPDPRDPSNLDNILLFSINSETGAPNKSFGKSFNLANYDYAIGGPSSPDYYGVSVRDTANLNLLTSTGRYPGQPGFSTTSLIEIQERLDGDNRVVVITTSAFGSEYDPVAIGYKLSDGQLDTTFGDNGVCRIQLAVNAYPTLYDTFSSSTCDDLGNIFVSGVCNSPIYAQGKNFYVAKIGINGKLDTSFNETGIGYIDIGWENKSAITVDKIGNVIVATTSYGLGGNLHLTRFCPDGKLDSNFGIDGSLFVTIPTATGGDPNSVEINAIKVLANGNYTIAFTTGVASAVVLFDSSGNALSNYVEGGYVDNNITATDATDFIIANEGDDSVYGENGNDYIDGGTGNDYLEGGTGNDYLYSGDGNDYLYSGDGNDFVNAGDGNDFIVGGDGAGDDVYNGGTGIDTVKYTSALAGIKVNLSTTTGTATSIAASDASHIGIDALTNIENIIAGSFDDILNGSTAANVIEGSAGKDTIDGGAGLDTADYSDKTSAVSVTLNGATAVTVKVNDIVEDTIKNIENIIGGSSSDTLIGDKLNNTFMGGAGNDILNGETGIDTADYSDKISAVSVTLNGANNSVVSVNGVVEDTIKNIENIIGGSSDDTFAGDSLSNWFRGGSGNDTIDGGNGNDTADYSDKTTSVSVTLNSTNNSVVSVNSVVEDTLKNIENITGGSGNDTLIGDVLDNILNGGAGNDTLKGASGFDTLNGGAGSDTADYSDKTSPVVITLNGATQITAIVNGVIEDTLVNIENLFGGSGNDSLTGDKLANVLNGYTGNDILKGGAGNDYLDGGAGTDTADYSDKTKSIVVTLNGAIESSVVIGSETDTIINIENIIGGSAADTLTGDVNNNVLTGGAGNDMLDGGGGNDTLIGGAGNDIYLLSSDYSGSTTIVEAIQGGIDSVYGDLTTYTLGDNLENYYNDLCITNNYVVINGNALNNTISTYSNRTISSEKFFGLAGNDTLIGGAGNDCLIGGVGNDILTGGTGADQFVFDSALDNKTNLDKIADFNRSDGDKLVLDTAVFTKLAAGISAGNLVVNTTGKAMDSNDYLIFNSKNSTLYYDADGSGKGASVAIAILTGVKELISSDFVIGLA